MAKILKFSFACLKRPNFDLKHIPHDIFTWIFKIQVHITIYRSMRKKCKNQVHWLYYLFVGTLRKYWTWSAILHGEEQLGLIKLLLHTSVNLNCHECKTSQFHNLMCTLNLFVKLREREGQGRKGWTQEGHSKVIYGWWMVNGGWWISFPWCFTLKLVATHPPTRSLILLN